MKHRHTNALISESSPYLLQHAHNPVDWMPWNEQTLALAKEQNKMLLISIGYSACHWCHVMEHESFEDEEVAQIMNDNFICVKVDREERPDVDDVYMTACQLSRGNACGWPLNAFALPDGRPVWAGTYFPKDQWTSVLNQMTGRWQNDKGALEDFASRLTSGIEQMDLIDTESSSSLNEETLHTCAQYIRSISDPDNGGRRGAPKFPMPIIYEFMLAYHYYTGDRRSLNVVKNVLDHMAIGGIRDHVAGGFARYSVDAHWLVPHFEKMLYDNAQLLSLYAKSYQVTQDPYYLEIAKSTADFILSDWQNPDGGLYSAYDADSEGEEGKYYVWSYEELEELLSAEEFAIARELFDIQEAGNWEHGKNIIHLAQRLDTYADENDLNYEELKTAYHTILDKLKEKCKERVMPGLDNKILCSWNAMAITGLVQLYRASSDESYLIQAKRFMSFVLTHMFDEKDGLYRNYSEDNKHISAFLEDYALIIQALIALYEVDHEASYIHRAKQLADYTLANFYNSETKLFHYTHQDNDDLVVRKTQINDNVIPGSNSMMARNLNVLYNVFFEEKYQQVADEMIAKLAPVLEKGNAAEYYANWCLAYLEKYYPTRQVAIVGPGFEQVGKQIDQYYLPNAIIMASKDGSGLEMLEEKALDQETMIYVCQNGVCKLPTTSTSVALEQLAPKN